MKQGRASINKNIVTSDRYHTYVPADTSIHVPKNEWNGLGLDVYCFSGDNDGITAPGVPDYILSTMITGYANGYYHINGHNWKRRQMMPPNTILLDKENTIGWQWRARDLGSETPKAITLLLDHNLVKNVALQTHGIDACSVDMPSNINIGDSFVHQLSLELKSEAENATPFGKLFGETAANLLAVHLLRKYATIHQKPPDYRGGLSGKILRRVTDYFNDHFNQDISLESLSILTGLSSFHFARMFKQSTGLAPHQYLVKCRINKAKELLKKTNLSIAQVALEVGYESQSHFTTLFKRMVGVTPKSYRDQV